MFSARVALLVLVVSKAGIKTPQADDYLWIEGEASTSQTMRRHGWYDSVAKENLSGGEWLSHFAAGTPPEAVFQLDVPRAGEYFFWIRANSVAGPRLSYRLGDGHVRPDATKDYRLDMLPSEIFARQVYVTYEDEKIGVQLIPHIGVDNVMWASDYPHGDSTWPHSRKALAGSSLAQHGPEVLRKVTCDNAARVYGFQV